MLARGKHNHRGLKTGRNRNFDGIFTERHHNSESISPTSHAYVQEIRIRPTQEVRSFRELVAHMIADHDTHIGLSGRQEPGGIGKTHGEVQEHRDTRRIS